MTARCHRCGREYLTARALAGKTVVCRSCGARNDGAGGPPPEPKPGADAGAPASRPSRALSGAAFSVGETPQPSAPRAPDATVGGGADEDGLDGRDPNPERAALVNRAVLAMGIGAALLACIVIGGVFLVRYLERNPDGARDWSAQLAAVPQILTDVGTGSGFVIEIDDELWLVTNLHVIRGAGGAVSAEVDVVFPDPETGGELVRIADVAGDAFRIDPGLLTAREPDSESVPLDLAVLPIERHRVLLESAGIEPLGIAASDGIRVGESVFAIGHPGSLFDFARGADARAANTARHTLTSGLVSAVRRSAGEPTLVQTDAAINPGNSGGPLLDANGDVVAVNTWRDVEVKVDGGTEARQGMAFSIAADEVIGLVKRGRSAEALASATATFGGTEPPDGTDFEETRWRGFPALRSAHSRALADGWEWRGRAIFTTGLDGGFTGDYVPSIPGRGDLLVLVLPEIPEVDADVADVRDAAGASLGADKDADPGDVAIVEILDAAHGGGLEIDVVTFARDQGIPAKFVILVFERPSRAAPSPPAPIVPSAPPGAPAPVLPSPNAPGQPVLPSQPSPATPASPSPSPSSPAPSTPTAPIAGVPLSSIVEFENGIAASTYASSLIGLREFDRRFLTGRTVGESFDAIERAFAPQAPNLVDDDPDFARDIMFASLRDSFTRPVADGRTLWASRPLAEARLRGAPDGTRVGIELEVEPAWRRYLAGNGTTLVSASADLELRAGRADADCRQEPATGDFHVALRLPWNDDELRGITQAIEIPFTLRARYADGSVDAASGRVRVQPPMQVERSYPFGLGVAAMVDEHHPWVKRILEEINHDPKVVASNAGTLGTGAGPKGALVSTYLVWRELLARGLRYQSLPAAEGIAQRCRSVHESLATANANCLDGTVLLASFLEAMGIASAIVVMPGHAIVSVDLGGRVLFIDTTALGQGGVRDPRTDYDDLLNPLRAEKGVFSERAFDDFEGACAQGLAVVENEIGEARRYLAEFRRLAPEWERHQSGADPRDAPWNARFEQVMAALGSQIMIVPVGLARANGVRPVGVPSDLDARFTLPRPGR